MTIMFQKFETYMTITPLLLFELGKRGEKYAM